MNSFERDTKKKYLAYNLISKITELYKHIHLEDIKDCCTLESFVNELGNLYSKLESDEEASKFVVSVFHTLLTETLYKRNYEILVCVDRKVFGNQFSKGNLLNQYFNWIVAKENIPFIFVDSKIADSFEEIIAGKDSFRARDFNENTENKNFIRNYLECGDGIIKKDMFSGRLLMLERFFVFFPELYKPYLETLETIFYKDNGLLPLDWKYYIAIMAVSTMDCDYLLKVLEFEFVSCGGDTMWLYYGLQSTPKKIQNLSKICNLIAFQPWKIQASDFSEIMQLQCNNKWIIEELIQALLIIVNFQRLATFAISVGLKIERNQTPLVTDTKPKEEEKESSGSNSNKSKKQLVEVITSEFESDRKESRESKDSMDILGEEMFNKDCKFGDISKFKINYCTLYLDFDSHTANYLSDLEFNWLDQGYYILKDSYTAGVNAINDEVISIMNHKVNVNSSLKHSEFSRNSVCYYIEKIMGINHDEFDYSQINKILIRSMKTFVKQIVCYPHKNSKMDLELLLISFPLEEILFVIYYSCCVKMRLQLTYLTLRLNENLVKY